MRTRNILLALLPVTILFLLLEGIFRLLPEEKRFPEAGYRETYSFSSLFIPHPFFAFAPNPEHPAYYGHGLREDRELALDTNRYRIVCLGGSATYGARVLREDAFPVRLEGLLNERGKDAEVLNAGVHAYNTANIIGWLSLRMIDLHPRMAVFYVGYNDVFAWVHFSGFDSDYSHAEKAWEMPDLHSPLWTCSAFLRRLTGWQPPLVHIHAVTFKPFSEDYEANYRSSAPTVFRRNLLTLAGICRAHGIVPVFALEATDFVGHPEGGSELMRVYGEGMAEADKLMGELASREGILRIDTSSLNNRAEFFADFIHLNEAGNQALARIMAEALESKLTTLPDNTAPPAGRGSLVRPEELPAQKPRQ